MLRFLRPILMTLLLCCAALPLRAAEAPAAGADAAADRQATATARPAQPEAPVANAYAMTIGEAARLAVDVMHFSVADYEYDRIRQVIRFTQVTGDGGFMIGRVEPRLLKASFGRTAGVTFDVRMLGASGVAKDAQTAFAEGLKADLEREAARRRVPTVAVIWPETVADRAEIVEAKRTVPREADVFEKFIKRRSPDPVEGVWERHDGDVLVGIYRDQELPGKVYRAMVLEPPADSGWRAGEIKFEMELIEQDLASGPFYRDDRARADVVWRVGEEDLVALNTPGTGVVRYSRLGPRLKFDGEPLHNGSAWVAAPGGYVVTNHHVIEDAEDIRVGFREGPWSAAKVVADDERLDIAVLKVAEPGFLGPPLHLSAGPVYPDGAAVTVLGYPLARRLGERIKVTTGVVSGQTGDKDDPTRLQHSAATQPGSSGGPVLDSHGNVIGVAVSTLRGEKVEQVNFAVKAGYVRLLLQGFGIDPEAPSATPARSAQEIARDLRGSVLPVWIRRAE